jgi:hypothetical protein
MFTDEEKNKIYFTKSVLWTDYIEPLVKKLNFDGISTFWDDAYVTGGCIGSILRGEAPNDIDIYFKTQESLLCAESLILTKNLDLVKDLDEGYKELVVEIEGKVVTANAITLKSTSLNLNNVKSQIIKCIYGLPDELRKSFDFVHCLPYFDIKEKKLFISKQQYDCCLNKKLIINNNRQKSFKWREGKFIGRGFTY